MVLENAKANLLDVQTLSISLISAMVQHRYVDDPQIQTSLEPYDAVQTARRLSKCLETVSKYYKNHGLRRNPNKSAVFFREQL